MTLSARRSIDGVLSSCDYYLKEVAAVAQLLNLPSSPLSALESSTNKYLMRVAHKERGLPTPHFMLAESVDDAVKAADLVGVYAQGRAIVKPADMNGSALVHKVESVEEMQKAIASVLAVSHNSRNQKRFHGALVEEFLPGEEFSVECCAYKGHIHILGITDKKLSGRDNVVEAGHMFPADVPVESEQALRQHVTEALKAIGYSYGVAHVEARLTPAGPRIIEINPRIGGNYISELIERVTGVSPLSQMIQVALGEKPEFDGAGTRAQSAAVAFCIPEKSGTLVSFSGQAQMSSSPGVVRHSLISAGSTVSDPQDNDCYLGYVVTEDYQGKNAGAMAASALEYLKPMML